MDLAIFLNFCFYKSSYEVMKCSVLFRSSFCQPAEMSSVDRSHDLHLDQLPMVPTPYHASVHLSHLGPGGGGGRERMEGKNKQYRHIQPPHLYTMPCLLRFRFHCLKVASQLAVFIKSPGDSNVKPVLMTNMANREESVVISFMNIVLQEGVPGISSLRFCPCWPDQSNY